MNFANLTSLTIPEGNANKVEVGDKTLFNRIKFRYVTIGDSVGAGAGVSNSKDNFTSLLDAELQAIYGQNRVHTVNHAIGGHTTIDLIHRLDEDEVRSDVSKANLITISIGGNDVLGGAFSYLSDYITAGDLTNITKEIQKELDRLKGGENAQYSAAAVLHKLANPTINPQTGKTIGINPNAIYVLSTQYNPYRYLWLDEGENGFFGPLLNSIPDLELLWGTIKVTDYLKSSLLNSELVKNVFKRVNGLCDFIEDVVNSLNGVLEYEINEFKKKYPSVTFLRAETKKLFETVPDRLGAGEVHYNDLLHVEYTRGYNWGHVNWGALWDNTLIEDANGNVLSDTVCNDSFTFWYTLIDIYHDGNGNIDMNGLIGTLLSMVANLIVIPTLDLHPKEDGYYVIMRSLAETLRANIPALSALPALKTVTYHSNNDMRSTAVQKVLDKSLGRKIYSITDKNSFTPADGYRFIGWSNTSGEMSPSYSNTESIYVGADTNLYAQWSNQCLINYKHTRHTDWFGDDETGHKESYALWINGVEMPDFEYFSDGSSTVYSVPLGSRVGVIVSDYVPGDITNVAYSHTDCHIYWNDAEIRKGYQSTSYEFTLTDDVEIDFRWKTAGILGGSVAGGENAQSWEDCHITTFDASYRDLSQLYNVSFNANGGTGTMTTQKILRLDNWPVKTVIKPLAFTHPTEGYYYTGWKNQNGGTYSNGQLIDLNSNLVLTAQWSNLYTLTYMHSRGDVMNWDSGQTGPMECYALWVQGTENNKKEQPEDKLGAFSNPPVYYRLPYGTRVGVVVQTDSGKGRSYIKFNGISVTNSSSSASYEFSLKGDAVVNFEWNCFMATSWPPTQSYWNCYITTS